MIRSVGLLAVVCCTLPVSGAGDIRLVTGRAVREDRCALGQLSAQFRSEDAAAFAHASLSQAAGQVKIEWIDPGGTVAAAAAWESVPANACLITQLPLAGYTAGRTPGAWKVRVTADLLTSEKTFRIDGRLTTTVIGTASVKPVGNQHELTLSGTGFTASSVVHVARFTQTGGWQYLAVALPSTQSDSTITVRIPALSTGEYIAIVRAADGTVSAPARFVIATARAYQLPVPPGEGWVISQGPHGSFSHWNRSEHAWDIAPRQGRYVVAMRAGTVHSHDLGMGRTPHLRSCGNYISIDHGDGEYSHYAHLATGRFLVRDGQHVEQGQRLAIVGNSGYTLGAGGGHHVHVHVTRSPAISAQSIPFEFNEERKEATTAAAPSPKGRPASVPVAQWWSELVWVPSGTASLKVEIAWDQAADDLDLHLTSPGGRHYGWYGDRTGYSGRETRPEQFTITAPEPGTWRISVQGMRGEGAIAFAVSSVVERKAAPAVHWSSRIRRPPVARN
ncbi:MAG: peptidoglycan DD-metalloendopeptidase family protein [Nitrospira sp.]|nr:peptidoglycan DD-metalloendopeptidase family protein [Nitrospira sp.]